ncbi:tyrosine-type recombinase/integrase [Hyphomicrobium denitrificans]|nr:site-specific integrase [Hyphomicrobium denitrificans]
MVSVAPNVLMIRRALNGPRATYSVAKHPRLFLATNGKGGGSWRIRFRPHAGAQQCWLTITNDARNVEFDSIVNKAKELISKLELEGVDPRSARPKTGANFDTLFARWLEVYAKVHKRSWESDEKIYRRHIKRRLGSNLVRSIDRLRVIDVLDDIAKAATPIQANRCQSVISAVFSWALDEGLVRSHPALRIRRRGEERVREFVMTDDQLRAFWAKLDGMFENAAIAVRLLLITGQRLGEVVGASADELSLSGDSPEWVIPGARTKNGLRHIVPLTATAVTLFEKARDIARKPDNPFVFPARRMEPEALNGNQVSRQCKEVFREIGAGHMRLHDLRHQAATGMAQCGVPLDIRQMVQNQITGRTQTIGAVYDQYDYAPEKRRALELWERRLLAVVAGKAPPTERYGSATI